MNNEKLNESTTMESSGQSKMSVRQFAIECLKRELVGDWEEMRLLLRNSLAIYLRDDGLSYFPFSGSQAPYAADGSDIVVHVWRSNMIYESLEFDALEIGVKYPGTFDFKF